MELPKQIELFDTACPQRVKQCWTNIRNSPRLRLEDVNQLAEWYPAIYSFIAGEWDTTPMAFRDKVAKGQVHSAKFVDSIVPFLVRDLRRLANE